MKHCRECGCEITPDNTDTLRNIFVPLRGNADVPRETPYKTFLRNTCRECRLKQRSNGRYHPMLAMTADEFEAQYDP